MSIYRILAVCFSVVLGALPAHAHHAWAGVFTDENIEVEGYVTEYNFRNPHINIMLSVTDEDGVETEWMATGPAAPPMRRWGWSRDTVQVGQYLRLSGRKSRTGAPMLVLVADDIQSGKFLEEQTFVRSRIVSKSINQNDPRSSKIGLNCKMDGLGAFDWLGEED